MLCVLCASVLKSFTLALRAPDDGARRRIEFDSRNGNLTALRANWAQAVLEFNGRRTWDKARTP